MRPGDSVTAKWFSVTVNTTDFVFIWPGRTEHRATHAASESGTTG
jgi:hypothetical protein